MPRLSGEQIGERHEVGWRQQETKGRDGAASINQITRTCDKTLHFALRMLLRNTRDDNLN